MELMLLIVIVAFVAAFVLAFAMGANDVANSFGTSVGSKVLTLRQAVIIAAIFETLGSVLVGYKVTETVRKGIVDISLYDTQHLALGALAALGGACLWLLTATSLRLPVSTTHSIVGATIGFSLVLSGVAGLQWKALLKIVASWFISPVLAGLISAAMFAVIRHFILRKPDPVKPGLIALPFIYGFAIFINALTILFDGSKLLGLEDIPRWISLLISLGIACVAMIFVAVVIVPWQRRRIADKARKAAEGVGDVLMDELERERLNAELTEISEKQKLKQLQQQNSSGGGSNRKSSPPAHRHQMKRAVSIESDKNRPEINGNVMQTELSPEQIEAVKFIHKTETAGTDTDADDAETGGIMLKPSFVADTAAADDDDAKHHAAEAGDVITALGKSLPPRANSGSVHHYPGALTTTSTPVSATTKNGMNSLGSDLGQSSNSINMSPSGAGTVTPPIIQMVQRQKSVVLIGPDGQPLRPISRDPSSIFTDFQRPRFDSTSGLLRRLSKRSRKERESRQLPPVDPPRTKLLFAFVQIMTAAFASFAHGGNDVSNSVGPLVTIWFLYQTDTVDAKQQPPIWILLFGGVGISIGLFVLGRKVIQTIGEDLTTSMTPSSGFCIELGTSFTVLLASKIGLPVSTTHCIVGSVIAVGYLRSKHNVDFKLVRNICMAWLVTLPVTIAFSAGLMYIFTLLLPYW